MKKILFLLVFVNFHFFSFAQVKEGLRQMSNGQYNALAVIIHNSNKKDVADAWIKYIKQFDGKTELVKRNGEIFTDNCFIKGMSNNNLDIYADVFEKEDKEIELVAWFYLGGNYLSYAEHPDRYPVGVKVMNDFAEYMVGNALEITLKEETKVLEDIRDDLSKSFREEDDLEKEIARLEEKLKEINEKLKVLKTAQKNKQEHFSEQEGRIKNIKNRLKGIKN